MTVEEAIERVLQGPQWEKCSHCSQGYARSDGKPVGTVDEPLVVSVTCKECGGSGAQLTAETKEAWTITGTELPSPWKVTRDERGNVQMTGPAFYLGKFPTENKLIAIDDEGPFVKLFDLPPLPKLNNF